MITISDMPVDATVLVFIWLAIFLISWLYMFRKVFLRALRRSKDPNSEERKAISEMGEVLIDEMYPKLKERIQGDAQGFIESTLEKIDMGKIVETTMERFDFDVFIEKAKLRLREEAGSFVGKLNEPPKEIKTKEGEVVLVFNDEQKWMWNLTATGFENIIRLLPSLLRKAENGRIVVDDPGIMALSEWAEDLMIQRFTLIMSKLKGQMSGLMENVPAEVLNNPDLLSSIADGAIAHIDESKCIAILGAKDGPKLHGFLGMAPDLLKLYKMWQGYSSQGASPGAATSSGPIARSTIQNF